MQRRVGHQGTLKVRLEGEKIAGLRYRGEGELMVFQVAGNNTGGVVKAVPVLSVSKLLISWCVFKGLS